MRYYDNLEYLLNIFGQKSLRLKNKMSCFRLHLILRVPQYLITPQTMYGILRVLKEKN